MKKTLAPLPFLLIFIFGQLHAQSIHYNLGWSVTYTYGKINNQTSFHPNEYTNLTTSPGFSANWPTFSNNTNLSFVENLLRLGVISFGLEYRHNNRWSILTGAEIGGRKVLYREYATEPGSKEVQEKNLANSVNRSFLVASIPILIKYKLYEKKLSYSLLTGIYLNESFSSSFASPFYTTPNGYLFYPTLSAGIRISVPKLTNFSIDCSYQQGLSEASSDKLTLYSAKAYSLPSNEYTANSFGSHFRIGIQYALRKNNKTLKQTQLPDFVPIENRTKGHVFKIDCLSDSFQICFEDVKTVDSDSIRVVFNNSTHYNEIELKDSAQCLTFDIHNQLVNTIDVFAINEGKIKPNTMTIRYTDKNNKRRALVVNNSMYKFIRIKVLYLK